MASSQSRWIACTDYHHLTRTAADGIRIVPAGSIDEILGADKNVVLRGIVSGDRRLFGESAGGRNVYSLLLSPRARGLLEASPRMRK